MQADSQRPGQWQNFHGNVDTSGDWTSNNPGHILHHQCVAPHLASFTYPNQIATGNELTQFSCTVLQTTSDKGLTSSTQSTENMMPPQENNFNSECTGKLNSHIIMWNMPSSNCQMFLPVNNINVQGSIYVASNNNGPNMSHCALRPSSETFNSNNSSYTQQQTTSISTGPSSSQQFEANRTMDTQSHNETERNVNTRSLYSRQQHANTANNLPKQTLLNQNLSKSAKKRKSSSTMKNPLPTENAPHRQSSPIGGYIYPSTCANPQTLSTCKPNLQQNNAAQKAVAVVTPLSPVEIASADSSNKSIHNTKISVLDARSAQGTIHHYPNIPHPLANTNLKAMGESNNPTSKHPRPSSGGEQRLYDGLCYAAGARSPVWTDESTSDSNCTASPKLHRVVTEQKESVLSTLRQANEKMPNNNCAVTDSQRTAKEETDRCSPIPVIEWSLDRLHTLIAMVQQIDDGHQKKVCKTDPGKEILKIYWNGDFCKFCNAAQTGIYQNIMKEVFFYCQKNDPVILRQIRGDKHNQIAKDFHILKHNETPPNMMPYKSSWLNLNEKLDDIDKECGFSWFYRSLHGTPQERDEHKVSNSACEMTSKLLDASAQLVAACHSQCQAEAVNKVPVEEQKCLELKDTKSDSESFCENMHVSLEQLQPVTDNCSTKLNVVLTEQAHSQPSIVNPLKTMTNLVKVLDKQNVPTEMSVKAMLDDRFCNDVEAMLTESTSQSNHTSLPKLNPMVAEQQEFLTSKIKNKSNIKMDINDRTVTDNNVRCKTLPKPNLKLTVHINKEVIEKIEASASIQINVLPQEMAKKYFAGEIMEDKDLQKDNCTPPDMMDKSSSLDTPHVFDPTAEKQRNMEKLELNDTHADNWSLGENLPVSFNKQSILVTDNCSAKINGVVTEKNNCPSSNVVNPLKARNVLVNILDKQYVSKRAHQHSTGMSEKPNLNHGFSNGVETKSSMLTESTSQSNCTRSTKLNPVVLEQEFKPSTQIQNGSNKNSYCTDIDKGVRCASVLKACEEEETEKMDISTSIQINVLPHRTAERCFAGEMMEDKDLEKDNAAPSEIMHKSSSLETPQVFETISIEKWRSMDRYDKNAKNSTQSIQSTLLDVPNKPYLMEHNSYKTKMANKVPVEEQSSLELQEKNSDIECLSEILPLSIEQSIAVADNHSPKHNDLVTEQTNSETNFLNPLMAMTNLLRLLEKTDVSLRRHQCQIGKHDILDQKHQYSTPSEGSRLGDRFSNCAGAKSLHESSSQSDGASSPKHNPVVGKQPDLVVSSLTQNESNEKLSNRDCAGTDNCMRDETEPNPCTEVVAYTKEDDIGLDSLASLKINVLSHYIAKQCFAGEVMEDNGLQKDSAAPQEMQHKSYGLHLLEELYKSFNDTPQIHEQTCLKLNQTLPENLPISFEQSLPVTDNGLPKPNGVVKEVTNCQPKFVNPLEAMTYMAKKLERLNVSNRKRLRQILNEQNSVLKRKHQCSIRTSETSRLDDHFSNCAGAKNLVLIDESSSQSDCTSSPKRNPFVAEQQEFVPSQIQTEPNEKITNNDCAGTDKSVLCETEPEPSGVAVDALASVQINVLSHEMAEQWFTGEMEDQSLEKAMAKHPSSEDQLKVLVLDIRSDTEVLIEDVKPKESNNQSDVHDELESYCCLAKWFQILQYGDGSSCKCQEKAVLNEKGTEIEAHATNLEVLTNKDDGSNAFFDECGPMELEFGSPERMDENASQSTEAKNPLMLHTNDAYVDKINIVKDNTSSEIEVFEVERVMSEQTEEQSPSKCATNETLKLCEVEKDPLDPDSKRQKTKTICLSLYGSSSDGSNKVMPTRRYQVKESCQEPPETLRVILSSHQKTEEKSKSNKRKWLESLNNEDALETRRKIFGASFTTIDPSRSSPSHEITQKRVSEVSKENALSSPSISKLVSPSFNPQSKVHFADGNRRKGKLNDRTKQISINKFIIRGKYMPSKSSLQSPLTVMKSQYEMGNPALMPLEEGLGLEFKVLPKSFNFTDGNELNGDQVDKSTNSKNEMSHPEDKLARRMKTSHATQGAWCFTPLKMKHTGSNQATDVSGSGSLFQEFKKRFHDKNRENASRQNLNSK
ncbi:uncharacterized protein si:ch211-106e7.2 [Myxocyprinus asiaticus]|uniref:uncharacterized protein si:ch211-106e7.2 n=1 Tax=Myxocyprinus asiaticus TaxID=70543 RepID=UPI0022233828|nr:uncharacterized protein si:ch211-106e7.2 [Myxocyprinus asiaticus]XP_051545783.1 uncharacterized protein si:ch211-106e7.2 [Myxocyprinus asiaticus]XP_051545784.1 uncharacterized protein si:ch211-106e7.2 [Myxocyprinus asiaticus]